MPAKFILCCRLALLMLCAICAVKSAASILEQVCKVRWTALLSEILYVNVSRIVTYVQMKLWHLELRKRN